MKKFDIVKVVVSASDEFSLQYLFRQLLTADVVYKVPLSASVHSNCTFSLTVVFIYAQINEHTCSIIFKNSIQFPVIPKTRK